MLRAVHKVSDRSSEHGRPGVTRTHTTTNNKLAVSDSTMSKRASRLVVLGLFALLLVGGCAAQDEQLEGLEEPIEPNRAPRIELPKDEGVFIKTAPAARSKGRAGATARQQETAANPLALPSLSSLNLYVELSAAVLVLLYVAIIVIGRRSNKRIAEAWARTFAMHGGIMDKNFSYTGPKETGALLMEESGNVSAAAASREGSQAALHAGNGGRWIRAASTVRLRCAGVQVLRQRATLLLWPACGAAAAGKAGRAQHALEPAESYRRSDEGGGVHA